MRLLLYVALVAGCGGGHHRGSDAAVDSPIDSPVDARPRCTVPYTPPPVHACATPWFPGRLAVAPDAVFGDGFAGKMAIGVDHDGRADVVMPDGIESFGVYRNVERDLFAAPVMGFAGEAQLSTAVLADLDRDGSLDVATTTVPGNIGTINTQPNAGNGKSEYPSNHIGRNLQPLAAIDTNADGNIDLVFVEPSGNDIVVGVMLGQADARSFFPIVSTFPTGKQVGAGAVAMTTADLDGDQHVDLVLGNQDGSVTVLAGTATGFAAPVSYAASTTGSATGIAAGDLDASGKPDVVLLANDHAFVLRNDGTGQLDLAGSYAAGDHPAAAAIGDLDHDGDADLVIADANIGHTSPSGTTILLGQGNATFAAPVAGPGPDATSVALADLDGNGALDLIAANPGVVSPWLGNGDGTFQTGRALSDRLQQTTLRDMTGDALLDRIGIANGGLVMSAGQPGATFAPETTLVAGTCTAYVLEDLDGDGNVDAVAACGPSISTQPGTATVVFGDGHGALTRTATITGDTPGTHGVITGDVDGECLADVMITSLGYREDAQGVNIPGSTQVFRSAADGTFTQIGADCRRSMPSRWRT